MKAHPRAAGWDAGFTLIELVITMVLLIIVMTISVASWNAYASARAHQGAAEELQAVLRNAQQRAVSEGTSVCVALDPTADAWTVSTGGCGASGTVVDRDEFDRPEIDLTSATFVPAVGETSTDVVFRSRGTADAGSLVIGRTGKSTAYTITIERLTGRVAIS